MTTLLYMEMARKRRFVLVQLVAITAVTLNCGMTKSCPKENYTIITKNKKLCIPCPSCSPGKGLVTPCDTEVYQNAPIDCRLCEPGKTFSPNTSKLQCQPCKGTTCHRNEKVDGVCNRREDSTSCTGTCNNNYYWSNNTAEPCQPCSYCGSTGNATRVKKCVNDGMPLHIQCKNETDMITKTVTPAPTKTMSANISEILPTTKSTQPGSGTLNVNRSLSTSKTNGSKGESPCGTPLTITMTIIVVLVLVIIALVVWIKCPRCRRCFKDDDAKESVGSQYQQVYLCGDVGNDMTETEQYDSARCENVDELSENNQDNRDLEDECNLPVSENNHDNRDLEDECDLPDVGTPFILEELLVRNGDEQAESNCETSLLIKQFSNSPVELVMENEQEPSSSTLQPLQIGSLPADVFEKICQKLNQDRPGKDWRTMAGKMGYTADDVATFSLANKARFADAVLHDWRTKNENNLTRLIEILNEMGRDDVVKIIEDSLQLPYADR